MTRTPRPPRSYTTDPLTSTVRVLAWAGCVATLVGAIVLGTRSTGGVPVHFDVTGTPDRYGSALEGVMVSVVLVACAALCLALSPFPRVFNYPVEVTETNAQAVYREGERLMVWIGTACVVLAVGATAQVLGGGGPLGALVGVGLAGTLVATAAGIWRTVRAGR